MKVFIAFLVAVLASASGFAQEKRWKGTPFYIRTGKKTGKSRQDSDGGPAYHSL